MSEYRETSIENRRSRYTPAVIILEGVRKRYPQADIDVLQGVDLKIEDGDFVSVVGRSGTGKTTLLNLIGGLDRSFEGVIEVAGRRLQSLDDADLSAFRNTVVGHVFQAYHLLDHLNCGENVALAALFARGQRRRDGSWVDRRAEELLEVVGLAGGAGRSPTTLSGGERQRVALARALFHDPAILLCDEPTGNLDLETGKEIVELLTDLRQSHDMTVVAATHDEAIAAAGSRVMRLHGGHLSEMEAQS
ncbi:MAG: ABC transporter ATP-binding protein [Acidobacteria bacterium]|nr:ABC transporter ATP-binding protein [Acidobacteriota bacterium]